MMEIQFISRETIKPSSPTPHHLRTYKLSLLDQIAPSVYIPILLFYSPTTDHISPNKNSALLKNSLSKTLTHFYPFAGRIKDCNSIDCNDDGATYIEAKVESDMAVVLKEQGNIDMLLKLLPCDPLERLRDPTASLILAVQVNYFACGGIAICVCISHGVADASAAASFLRTWSAVASGIDIDLDGVVFDCTNLFPPLNLQGRRRIDQASLDAMLAEVATKRFVFDGSKVDALRNETIRNVDTLCPNLLRRRPTRVEAVSSLIWKALITSGRDVDNDNEHVTTIVNLRNRLNPPLPQLCIGNIYHVSTANIYSYKAILKKSCDLNSLAEKVNESILKINYEYIRKLHGSGEYLNVIKDVAAELLLGKKSKTGGVINFTSWCRFPFYETDFGWGKPIWFATAWKFNKIAILLDTSDGMGIEAWIGLSEDEMTKLEQDPGILAYASFSPTCIS